jgi:hypothetical protein
MRWIGTTKSAPREGILRYSRATREDPNEDHLRIIACPQFSCVGGENWELVAVATLCAKLRKVATVVLATMNFYPSLESCIGNEPQGGAIGHSPPGKGTAMRDKGYERRITSLPRTPVISAEPPLRNTRSLVGVENIIEGRRKQRMMTERARKIRYQVIPEWARGLYYNNVIYS